MALTLEQYDHQIGFHLRMIHHHSKMLLFHTDSMTHQPAFETIAEGELKDVAVRLAEALETALKAVEKFRSRPVDS